MFYNFWKTFEASLGLQNIPKDSKKISLDENGFYPTHFGKKYEKIAKIISVYV